MPDSDPTDAHLAFLYVSGEMDAADASAFERRLGEEQPLRETLCQAVALTRTLEGLAPPLPRPEYRQRVRHRLRPAGWWQRLTRRRTYRGHPALWSVLGAATALLAVLMASPSVHEPSAPTAPPPPSVAEQTRSSRPQTQLDEPADSATIEEAEMWANMPNSDHLARTYEEEGRRRDRRLTHGEHAPHLTE